MELACQIHPILLDLFFFLIIIIIEKNQHWMVTYPFRFSYIIREIQYHKNGEIE